MLRTLGLFGITLVSYYDYDRNITWGYIFGVAILFLDAIFIALSRQKINVQPAKAAFAIVSVFMLYVILSSIIGAYYNGFTILWQRSAFVVFAILILYAVNVYRSVGIKIMEWPLTIVLVVHLVFYYIQLVLVGFFSMEVDFIEPITGESQRIFGGSYDIGLFSQFFRPAGLFAEPGTYANMIFIIFLLREAVRCNGAPYSISNYRDGIIVFLLILSLILSFSLFAFIFVLVFALSVILKSQSRQKFLIMFMILFTPLASIMAVYLQQRFALGDESGTGFRYEAILVLMQNLDWVNALIGWGFLSDFTNMYLDITFNDLGLLFNIFLQGGLFGFLFWSLIFLKFRSLNGPEIALAVALQLTKFTLTYPVIWLALIIVAIGGRQWFATIARAEPFVPAPPANKAWSLS